MAEAEQEKSPGFSKREKHTIYSIAGCMFVTIYGIQKRDSALRALGIPQDGRLVVHAGDRRSQGKSCFG